MTWKIEKLRSPNLQKNNLMNETNQTDLSDARSISMFSFAELQRLIFRYAVKSGLRAALNRRKHRIIRRTLTKDRLLPDQPFVVKTFRGSATFRYWHRGRVAPADKVCCSDETALDWDYGILAGQLVEPRIAPVDYRLVCRTSHFGDAHFEAAFRYRHGDCRVYAIKNIARDYCTWVNRDSLSDKLSFGTRRNEAVELYRLFESELLKRFDSVCLDAPEVCIRLAVQPHLIAGDQRHVLRTFRQRYERLIADLVCN